MSGNSGYITTGRRVSLPLARQMIHFLTQRVALGTKGPFCMARAKCEIQIFDYKGRKKQTAGRCHPLIVNVDQASTEKTKKKWWSFRLNLDILSKAFKALLHPSQPQCVFTHLCMFTIKKSSLQMGRNGFYRRNSSACSDSGGYFATLV